MRMSIASTNSPSTFLSTPSIPTSAIWCCAQLDEQPAKCRRKSSPWPFLTTWVSRKRAISAARTFVWTLASPQNSLPVQVCRPRMNCGGIGESSCGERLGQQRLDAVVGDPRQQHVLLVGEADLGHGRVLAGEPDELVQLVAAQAADRDAEADRGVLAVVLRGHADVVVAPQVGGARGGAGSARGRAGARARRGSRRRRARRRGTSAAPCRAWRGSRRSRGRSR